MSDTPRTDALKARLANVQADSRYGSVVEFARTLERELRAALIRQRKCTYNSTGICDDSDCGPHHCKAFALAAGTPDGAPRVRPQICDGFHAATCPHQTQCEIEGECIQRMNPQSSQGPSE